MMFPNAKIVNCVRDLRDVAVSIYTNKFVRGNKWAQDLGEIYHMANMYQSLMKHWKEVLPIQIYDSNYEKLVNDFEEETRKLISYCELDWEDSCLKYYKAEGSVETASKLQVKQPIFKSSLNKWKNYEPYFGKELRKIGELNS